MALSKKQRRELRKQDRRHKANQLRRNKKESVNQHIELLYMVYEFIK